MGYVALAARIMLAAVFAVSGIAKLANLKGLRQTAADFGVPNILLSTVVIVLPTVELAAAVALTLPSWVALGAIAALALLVLFTVFIAFSLASGRTPSCQCFGQLSSAPVGASTLLRNGLLVAIGALLVWAVWSDADGSFTIELSAPQIVVLTASVIVAALLAFGGWIVLHLLEQQGRLLARVDALEARAGAARGMSGADARMQAGVPAGLPVGVPAPEFRLASVDGETQSLSDLRNARKPIVLLFTDANCGPCACLLPDIRRWQRDYAPRLSNAAR